MVQTRIILVIFAFLLSPIILSDSAYAVVSEGCEMKKNTALLFDNENKT